MIRALTRLVLATFVMLTLLAFVGGNNVQAFSANGKLCSDPNVQSTTFCQTSASNPVYGPTGVLTKAVRLISIVTGIASVIIIILAGIQYMIAEGDSSKINSAKNTLLYAVIGLAITVVSQSVVVFVLNNI